MGASSATEMQNAMRYEATKLPKYKMSWKIKTEKTKRQYTRFRVRPGECLSWEQSV